MIPPKELKDGDGKTLYEPSKQFYRTPFLVGFRAGWFKFLLTTVHMVFGKGVKDDPKRVKEIELAANFLKDRAGKTSSWSQNLILLGDFNIFSPADVTMKAITDAGFEIPEVLQEVPESNVGKKKRHYDQIAFMVQEDRLEYRNGGVFDFYDFVYMAEDEEIYEEAMGERYHTKSNGDPRTNKTTYYRTYWRTHQMSDHLVMWVELGIDFGKEYLEGKAQG